MKRKKISTAIIALTLALIMALSPMVAFAGNVDATLEMENEFLDLPPELEYDDCTGYVSGQVVVEVFYTESGYVVSREYFYVHIPIAEFNSPYQSIMPLTTLSPTRVRFASSGSTVLVATINTSFNPLGHSRNVNFLTSNSTISRAHVFVRTGITNANLGSATLDRGQSMRIAVPFNTLYYHVWAVNYDTSVGGGYGNFSVTS